LSHLLPNLSQLCHRKSRLSLHRPAQKVVEFVDSSFERVGESKFGRFAFEFGEKTASDVGIVWYSFFGSVCILGLKFPEFYL
jgi:hypothetical protein